MQQALNGETALRVVQETPSLPDLIMLDIMMPGINGFEVCQNLKSHEALCDIPVLFISALDDIKNKVRAFKAGGVDYIIKPFQTEEVLSRIGTHLKLRMLQKQLQEKNIRLQEEIIEHKKTAKALEAANEELKRLANMDGLTSIANRRVFDERLPREWKRAKRDQTPISLIICDIDHFKMYNDCYGHQAGDDSLRKIAQTISNTLKRPADIATRYGGEEFAVILPNTTAEGAMYIAQMIQKAISELNIPHCRSIVSKRITLSLGVASLIPTNAQPSDILVSIADKALYEAKYEGRDRIVMKEIEYEK